MIDAGWQKRKTAQDVCIAAASTHVWLLPCNRSRDTLGELYRFLNVEERARTNRYHFERDRERFVAARGAVRLVLAGYLRCDPADVSFDFAEHGKPLLAARHATSIQFNTSTSHDWSMLAVTLEREVGIDIERIDRDRADPGIVEHYFAPAEVQALGGLDDDAWLCGFFNCWTRKEAFVKVTGEGLTRPLHSFEVSLVPGQPASLIRVQGCDESRWQMTDLAEVHGYASALAVAGSIGELQNFRWSPL